MEKLDEVFIMLILAIGMGVVVFILAKYNYLIKKAMIEKGLIANQLTNQKLKYLDVGCIIVGLGLGFIVSSIYTEMNLSEDTTDLLAWGTIAIFGGISVILAHFLRKKSEK